MTVAYTDFLERRAQLNGEHGFDPLWTPEFLFPFQAALVEWATRKGRSAIFADCGLGKSPMQLVWAENVHRKTGRPVLIVTPLAVAYQTEAEAQKFGIDAAVSRDGKVAAGITITNYDRLHLFDRHDYSGAVGDESSAIKAFDGHRRALVTNFLRKMPYRLLCTATAAPNDYIELGTSSEALGHLGYVDMLNRFFTNKQRNTSTGRGYLGEQTKWRFKGHAEQPFWRWVASWARAMRRPSDYGYADDGFVLPDLIHRQHVIEARHAAEGTLFDLPAVRLREEQEEARRTIIERCGLAAELAVNHKTSILWCNLNAEGDLLERLVPQAIQVKGSDADEYKEAAARWFAGHLCICDHQLFRRKLAAWRGNLNTQRLDKLVTKLTQPSGNDAALRDAPPKPTASTCGSTTPPTASVTPSTGEPPPIDVTNDVESGTPPTPNTARSSNNRPETATRPPNETRGSAANSASAPSSSMLSSPSKPEAAASAEQPSGTVRGGDSTSTTATTPDKSEDCSAQNATSGSASSGMTPTVWNEPPCICGHVSGVRRLITKPVMFGLGLNFQHCAHMTFFPTHSYEQYYQAVRRCWRFGQTHPVTVDIVTTEGGARVLANLQRKAEQADRMFDALVAQMRDAISVRRATDYPHRVEVPLWAC